MKKTCLRTVLVVAFLAAAASVRLARTPDYHAGKIAFSYLRDVWVVNEDSSNPLRLTDNVGRDINPRFSPDGKWIALSSNRFGNNDVFVMAATGGRLSLGVRGAGVPPGRDPIRAVPLTPRRATPAQAASPLAPRPPPAPAAGRCPSIAAAFCTNAERRVPAPPPPPPVLARPLAGRLSRRPQSQACHQRREQRQHQGWHETFAALGVRGHRAQHEDREAGAGGRCQPRQDAGGRRSNESNGPSHFCGTDERHAAVFAS